MLILTNEEDKMRDLQQLEQDRRDLQEALAQFKKTKIKILIKSTLLLPVFILFSFLLPLLPGKGNGKSLSEIMGKENSIIIIGTFFIVVLIWVTIHRLNQYKLTKFDIETDIALIDSKIAKLKEENQ